MVRDRQLPTPTIDPNLAQSYMETEVRRNKFIESAWLRASPKMGSFRLVTLRAPEFGWIDDIQRGFMVPGGRYFMIFTLDKAYTLYLEELSRAPVLFISTQDVNMEGLDIETCSWNTGRPDD
ncbi:hypothetical protein FRC01_007534, partial [Tulasnella sp. 417]